MGSTFSTLFTFDVWTKRVIFLKEFWPIAIRPISLGLSFSTGCDSEKWLSDKNNWFFDTYVKWYHKQLCLFRIHYFGFYFNRKSTKSCNEGCGQSVEINDFFFFVLINWRYKSLLNVSRLIWVIHKIRYQIFEYFQSSPLSEDTFP